MGSDSDFKTITMARVYESQGLWNRAAEIYRYLLEREPSRTDIAKALENVEKKMDGVENKNPDDLIPLFREWIDLLFRYDRLRRLRSFKRQLQKPL